MVSRNAAATGLAAASPARVPSTASRHHCRRTLAGQRLMDALAHLRDLED